MLLSALQKIPAVPAPGPSASTPAGEGGTCPPRRVPVHLGAFTVALIGER